MKEPAPICHFKILRKDKIVPILKHNVLIKKNLMDMSESMQEAMDRGDEILMMSMYLINDVLLVIISCVL